MNTRKRQRKSPCHGFTLVEILVAMTLLGMIFVILFGSLHTAGRSWQSGTQKMDNNDEMRVIAGFIRRQIAQAIPVEWANRDGRRLVFHGDHDQLIFASTLPTYRGGGGLYILTLKVTDTGSSRQLELAYQRADPGESPFTTGSVENKDSVMLAENIDAIEFTYFGSEGYDTSPRWYDEWPIGETLPSLVRMKIISAEAGRDWPEMDIAIRSMPVTGHPQVILQDQREVPLS